MSIIGITGGTGFVGSALAARLAAAGHEPVIFTRSPKKEGPHRQAFWNPAAGEMDTAALKEINAVVHLAGAGVADHRWTPAYKKEILESRVNATGFLVQQLQQHAPSCDTFIAASATGYYGPDKPGLIPFTETSPPCSDFLGEVCRMWEEASLKAQQRYRTVILRFGIVLGNGYGAYKELTKPMKLGLKPILGAGSQVVSWIHIDDLARLLEEALSNAPYSGIYNAVSPQPVSHRDMMDAIAGAKGGLKIPAPVPGWLLGAIMGESSIEVLKSCTASAEKLMGHGFRFLYPGIGEAVKQLESAAG